jgi:hypothetical protein
MILTDRELDLILEDLAEADGVETPIIDPSHKDYVAERALARLTDLVEIPDDGYPLKPRTLILGWTVDMSGLSCRFTQELRPELREKVH